MSQVVELCSLTEEVPVTNSEALRQLVAAQASVVPGTNRGASLEPSVELVQKR